MRSRADSRLAAESPLKRTLTRLARLLLSPLDMVTARSRWRFSGADLGRALKRAGRASLDERKGRWGLCGLTCRAAKITRRMQIESNRKSRLAPLAGRTMALVSAIGTLLIIASVLNGCALMLPVIVLGEIEKHQRYKRSRSEVESEIRARPVGDPGPTATVAMVPLGGSAAESVEQSRTDSIRCEIDARSGGVDISDATLAELATERYVRCMAAQGYRCANRADHQACAAAWTHPTATRTELLQDAWECKRSWRTTFALASTLWARYLECLRSKGYRPDVGEPRNLNHENARSNDGWFEPDRRMPRPE
jgi:hypothetical protein